MRLTLPTKTALLTTALVLFTVGATGAWQYRGLSSRYVILMQQQQQGFAQLAAGDVDYKIASHLDILAREARHANAATFASSSAQQRFLADSGLRAKFDGLALIDPDGAIVASDPPNPKALNIADRDYFRRARDSGEPAISAPLQARTTDQPAIVMVVPVHDGAAGMAGMVGGGLSLSKANVLGELSRARVGEGGYFLIETTGPQPVYVVHPDPLRVLKPASSRESSEVGDLIASVPIRSTGWVLRVVLPAAAAYAPLARARETLLGQMLLLALLSSVLVWIGTVWMMRPLGRLHGAIHALRKAPDRTVPLDVHAEDELGDLAREFDALMTELRNQRTELATITDASPMGLFRCDMSGHMVYVNDAFLEIQGLPRADAARGWLSLVAEPERDAVWRQWLALTQQTQPFHVKRWLRRLDGTDVLVSLHMRPILTDGQVTGQVGTLSDITERTRAEKAMRTLTGFFEATTDYVVQLNKSGRLTYMNPAARRVTGIAPDAPVSDLTMADFYPPATVAHLSVEVVPAAAAQGVWVGELDLWNAERVVFPVSQMVIAHRDRNGKIEHFSAIMRDISADKANKRALFESEARLRTVADVLPMRVAYIGADERYQFANLAYEPVFGVSRKSIEGQTIEQLFGKTRYLTIAPHVRAALGGERVTFESEAVNSSGHASYEVSYIPQWSVDGLAVVGFHAVTLDITRQKREERRLAELASQDPLTGLGNRSAFEARLADAMNQSRLRDTGMALLYVDLDRFKQINDRWGHPCGDALLRAVGARLSTATRNVDFVARLGGDEFTVILQALGHPEDAERVAQKILKSLNEPFVLDERTLNVGASVGVACYEGGHMTSQALIRKADEMLYQAKGAGRNNVQVAPAHKAAGV
ncbi:diguanylate cyclase domain-containing protein [Variovorax sp. PAMC 28711]|uniref:diguanylate cyclase domain-containing protein n=1 Tax=Variovorax sp. PAMC 28711 TaxID=1795631 RepID=UPI00078BA2D3|nr:diguanylate cyclase [Variovorax sp. PAMC 28711]AMM25026.1 hypothetical protein AX767_12130 [Variovorax sp. PAMC 28711]